MNNPSRLFIALGATLPFICGVGAVLLGKDVNWDFRNYHYYNAYALLEGRLLLDIAPAQLQTYLNPLLDIPFYLLTQYFNASTVGFIAGWVHGFNLCLLLLIFYTVCHFKTHSLKLAVAIMMLIVAGLGPTFIGELGSTMNDNTSGLFVLSSIAIIVVGLVKSINSELPRPNLHILALAGLVMGLGVGLKLTVATYALASAFALMLVIPGWLPKLQSMTIYAISGIIGGVASGAYWFWTLWNKFGNPLFPFYNHIFKSPDALPVSYKDMRFLPDSVWEHFIWPFIFSADPLRVLEIPFFDLRFVFIFLLLAAWLITQFPSFNVNVKNSISTRPAANFLIIFFIVSFALWTVMFSIYRYLFCLEVLAPLVFYLVLHQLAISQHRKTIVALLTFLIVVLTTQPFSYGRAEWSKDYVTINTPLKLDSIQNAVVIMTGYSPTAYVAPMFASNNLFIRPEGNLELNKGGNKLYTDIQSIITKQINQSGPIFTLSSIDQQVSPATSLLPLGIPQATLSCDPLVVNNHDHLSLCKVNY